MAEGGGGGLDARWQWLSQRVCNYFKTTPDRFQALLNKDECRWVIPGDPWGLGAGTRSPCTTRACAHARVCSCASSL
jgi:hypothetical protein